MKKTSMLLAALVLAVAAKSPAQTDLIARIHFAGADRISANPNHLAFTNEFCSTEARALESQTLDKLSRAPGAWFKSKLAPGAGDGAAQLRPLLDDMLKSEWILEMRDAPGSPEYVLAIRLDDSRAQLWSKNLAAVLQSWTSIGIVPDKSGNWELKKHEPPDLVRFVRVQDWVVVGIGEDQLPLTGQVVQNFSNLGLLFKDEGWLTADLNWPRLAQIFPALKEFDLPKIQMQVVGRGGNLRLAGRLTLAQPLPPLEKWRLPASSIRQPLVSFTAARGVAPWLARQPWLRPLEIQLQPDQLFIWALAGIPFETFAAEPVPDAKAALAQLEQRLSADTAWQNKFFDPFTLTNANNEISWRGLPFISPFIQATHESAGDFLVAGFFPNAGQIRPLPPELSAALNPPNLVYYHWEVTGPRLHDLPQLSQLVLLLTQHRQLDGQSAAAKWLDHFGPALGSTITEVTQTAPAELAFQRTAPGGLTAIELLAFANWLESPQFPAFDLRMPPPHVRPGQRPFKMLSMPPGAPAPAHP